jgi:nucleoside-diphosphate-sugar epimerase
MRERARQTVLREVVVTGATGFVGTALVQRLLCRGVPVVRVVRPGRQVVDLPGVRTVSAILHDVDDLRRSLAGVSASHVVHLAAYGVRPQDRDPQALVDGNVGAVSALLQVAAQWPLERFVHIGSCAEYGMVGPAPLTEDQPLRPSGSYGAAKASASLLGTALAAQLGLPFTILRLFGTYGPGEGPGRLVPWLVRDLARNAVVQLTPGLQVRDFTYIDDVVEAIVSACSADLPPAGVYHVCSGEGHTVRGLAERVANLMGAPLERLHWGELPARFDEPAMLVGNPTRFALKTGWRATTSLDQGLQTAIDHALREADHG